MEPKRTIAKKTMPAFGGVKRSEDDWKEMYIEDMKDKDALYAEIKRLEEQLRRANEKIKEVKLENKFLKMKLKRYKREKKNQNASETSSLEEESN